METNRFAYVKSYLGVAGLAVLALTLLVFRVKPDWKLACEISGGIGLLLFIAYIVLNFREVRDALRGRATLYSLNTLLAVAFLVGILFFVNYLSSRHHKRWDITEGKIHSLSDQSLKVLANLEHMQRNVEITAFFKEGDPPEAKMRDMLDMYTSASRRLKTQFFDPAKNPGLAKRYNIEEYNTTVFTSGDKEAKIKGVTEEEITNALIQVSRDQRKTIYFLEGHGEVPTDEATETSYSVLREQLEKENYVVKKLMLVREPGIPPDCSVLVVAGPRASITPPELKVIDEYLQRGGRAMFLLDPRQCPGAENFLRPWGIRLGDDVIVDRVSRVFGGDELMPIVSEYEGHDMVKNFRYATFYPLARSVDVLDKNDRGATVTVVGRSSQESWAETDPKTAEFEPGQDRQGPIPLIVAVTAEGKKKAEPANGSEGGKALEEKPPQMRMVVVGDSDFPNNTYYGFSGNGNLFLNMIAWLAEEEDLISIRPSTQRPKTVSLTREQASLIFYSSLIGLPALVLLVGFVIWIRRKNR